MRTNLVPYPPSGLVVAVQYWSGDELAAMRLARLMADIEPEHRDDIVLALARSSDTPKTRIAMETFHYCSRKFRVMTIQSNIDGTGHPAGANALWAGTFQGLWSKWQNGNLSACSVFFVEADGVPIRRDWLTAIKAEHEANVLRGKRVTGAVMTKAVPHVNGNLVSHLSVWGDRRSIHNTPSEHAWDMYHAGSLLQEAAGTQLILNAYGAVEWTPGVLEAVRHETVYLANVKDGSAMDWAEHELVDELDVPKGDVIKIRGARG